MLQQLRHNHCFSRRAAFAASAILLLGLCGCQTAGTSDITGSLGEKSEASRAADPRRELEVSRERFRANPKDADAALQYAKALRATGQKAQAAAMLEQATIAHPGNKALLAGYGRALADRRPSTSSSTLATIALKPSFSTVSRKSVNASIIGTPARIN